MSITEAKVLQSDTARIGSRVKHYGQRYIGCATATVEGFIDVGHESPDARPDYLRPSWIIVLVRPDNPDEFYGSYPKREDGLREWDWDRTEVAPDV
jgi:hypothetical protein